MFVYEKKNAFSWVVKIDHATIFFEAYHPIAKYSPNIIEIILMFHRLPKK